MSGEEPPTSAAPLVAMGSSSQVSSFTPGYSSDRPKRGELEYRHSIHSISPASHSMPSSAATPSQPVANLEEPKEERKCSLWAYYYFIKCLVILGLMILTLVEWPQVIARTRLRWLNALLLVVVGILLVLLWSTFRSLYLSLRQAHLSNLPLHRDAVRLTDGKTSLYTPRGTCGKVEWLLWLSAEKVVPVVPLPRVPAYERGNRGLDADTIDVLVERAMVEGIAPTYGSDEMTDRRVLELGPAIRRRAPSLSSISISFSQSSPPSPASATPTRSPLQRSTSLASMLSWTSHASTRVGEMFSGRNASTDQLLRSGGLSRQASLSPSTAAAGSGGGRGRGGVTGC